MQQVRRIFLPVAQSIDLENIEIAIYPDLVTVDQLEREDDYEKEKYVVKKREEEFDVNEKIAYEKGDQYDEESDYDDDDPKKKLKEYSNGKLEDDHKNKSTDDYKDKKERSSKETIKDIDKGKDGTKKFKGDIPGLTQIEMSARKLNNLAEARKSASLLSEFFSGLKPEYYMFAYSRYLKFSTKVNEGLLFKRMLKSRISHSAYGAALLSFNSELARIWLSNYRADSKGTVQKAIRIWSNNYKKFNSVHLRFEEQESEPLILHLIRKEIKPNHDGSYDNFFDQLLSHFVN